MKKAIFFIILLSFFVIPVSAISTDMKESYSLGETMIIEIFGDILEPIFPENVEFRRGHVKVPFDYDIKKLGDRYFLWAVTPESENNYTLVLKDVTTTIQGKVQGVDFMQNFSVTGNLSDYSIKPGFIFARDDFEISVQFNEDLNKNIETNFPETREIILNPGLNKIVFSIEDINETQFLDISIGKYNVPAYIIKENDEEIVSDSVILPLLRFIPRRLSSTLFFGQLKDFPISIVNEGNETVENISFDYNKELFSISPEEGISIEPNETYSFNLIMIRTIDEGIDERVYARYDGFSIEFGVEIDFTVNENEISTPYLEEEYEETLGYRCSELAGDICSASETCSGEGYNALDGTCCIGECLKPTEGKGGKVTGIIIFVIIAIGILFVWRRYKRVKVKHPLDKVKEASKSSLP